jgi:Na+-transporting NADH:ubiquinone oxidoreductase subunit NqrF
MPDMTVDIINATGTVFTAVALIITAFAALNRSRRVEGKIDQVHVIVNQQRTDAQNYNRALIAALHKAGVDVPADQSVDPGPQAGGQ